MCENITISCVVKNLDIDGSQFDFGDFKFIKIRQGPKAAEWRKKMSCKEVPRHILTMNFMNYEPNDDDITGYDCITNTIEQLLLLFRLYKVGDIMFGDFLIENHSTNNNSIGKFCDVTLSTFKYSFSVDEINKFKKFKREIINKGVLTNPLYRLATNSFMRGVNKAFYYEIDGLDRIVDYTIALESLFLADNAHYFLGSTIGKRVSKFLNDGDSSKIVKYMYNERSNIVHGNYLDLDSDKIDKRMKKIKERMCSFEDIMRKILRKMYDHNFENLNSLILYIEGLYKLPDKSLEIMLEAKKKAEKYLSC